ncbi:MAG: hypothetical protein P3A29_06260 [Gemmatimonadota bacterium]|nr:hypothetical protein [Gemmatimonadota bacterium]
MRILGTSLMILLASVQAEGQTRGLSLDAGPVAIRVTAVRAATPGARAALRAGDVIERIVDERSGTAIATTPSEIMTWLRGPETLSLVVRRGTQTVIARLDGEGGPSVPSFDDPTSVPSFDRPTAVPAFDRPTNVPSFDRPVSVPSTGGTVTVPSMERQSNQRPSTTTELAQPTPAPATPEQTSGPDRTWRRACAELRGIRPNRVYQWLSASGAATEKLWLNGDGSYALHRSSAVSSYAEDGCYQIQGKGITLYAVASSALATSVGATREGKVTLGSSSTPFTRRTLTLQLIDGGRTELVLDGERYRLATDR